jgi:phage terminase large subunit GpA-like protein
MDYGAFPDQGRAYFTNRDAKVTLARLVKGGLEAQIAAGLDALTGDLFGRVYRSPTGAELRIERLMVDANWGQSTDVVYDFCRRSPHAALILPSHGRYVGASSQPMSEWKRQPGERIGHNWRMRSAKRGLRAVHYDTNAWKSWVASRFLTAPGDAGCLTLYGRDPMRHQMIADQMSSEHRVRTTGRGRTVDEWRLKPGRDNHLLDGVVGSAVAASIQGMPVVPPSSNRSTGGSSPASPANAARMSFAALQRAAREKRSA